MFPCFLLRRASCFSAAAEWNSGKTISPACHGPSFSAFRQLVKYFFRRILHSLAVPDPSIAARDLFRDLCRDSFYWLFRCALSSRFVLRCHSFTDDSSPSVFAFPFWIQSSGNRGLLLKNENSTFRSSPCFDSVSAWISL